ncbi:MAG: sugar phosphate isomerase/epimerase family protein [Alphaproteobacteria bacterium]
MPDRLLSLATGTLPEFTPVEVTKACAEAGWPACGIWYDPETWTDATTRDVKRTFSDTGIIPLDIEVVWIQPDGPDPNHQKLIAAGGEIGARNVLIVSSDPDRDETKRRFEEICGWAEAAGMNACLEFLPITEIKTLQDALDVLNDVDHPAARLLVDPTHLARSGGHPSLLKDVSPDLLSYAQFCDGVAALADNDIQTILNEAVDGRLLPGEGALPIAELLAVLPADLPLAVELRSKALRDSYPDPVDRAKAVLDATKKYLG